MTADSGGDTMIAAVMRRAGEIEVDEFPIPRPEPGEALVRMSTAAICGSDAHVLFDGFAREDAFGRPGYPGHEGVGEVVDSRSALFQPGDRVLTVPPGWYGGCFAEYQTVAERWLLPLPDDGDMQGLLMAQQLGTTIFGLRKFWPGEPGSVATVIGAGSAGLFFLQLLKRRGFPHVVVCDLDQGRLDIARKLGADSVVRGQGEAVVEATRMASNGEGADLVIEAAGFDETRRLCIECARKWGRVGYFGYPEQYGLAPFPFERAYRKALTIDFIIDTALEPELRSFREGINAIHTSEIEAGYLLGDVLPLARIREGLEFAHNWGTASVKIRIDLANTGR